MKPVLLALLALATLALGGCAVVTSSHPVGSVVWEPEPEAWDGHWVNRDGVARILVTDRKAGQVVLAAIEERDGDLEVDRYTIDLRGHGEMVFANVRDDDSDAPRYLWGAVALEDGNLLVWLPDPDRVAELLDAGKLPGERNDDVIHLAELDSQHLDLIASDPGMFLWAEPLILMRWGE